MICTNCYEKDYITQDVELWLGDEGMSVVKAEVCPACSDTVFTHAQSLVIDQIRLDILQKCDKI